MTGVSVPLDSRVRGNDVWVNHDCHDGVMIAMIFPSLPLWIPACAGMTLEIPRCARNDRGLLGMTW